MLELAFSWLAARPQVSSVIAGATRVEQVEQNVKAIGWALTRGGDRGDRRDYEVGYRQFRSVVSANAGTHNRGIVRNRLTTIRDTDSGPARMALPA